MPPVACSLWTCTYKTTASWRPVLSVQPIFTVRPRSKVTVFHLSPLLLLLPPSRLSQIMSVLSERPTIPPDTSQPTIIPATNSPIAIPDVVVNGKKQTASASLTHRRPQSSSSNRSASTNEEWGSNFWVTLVDPQVSTFFRPGLNVNPQSDQISSAQTNTQFYACPATGQVSWDPPVGSFL